VRRGHRVPLNPGAPETNSQAEAAALEPLGDLDLVILARDMQIVSVDFWSRLPERLINIRHSRLPAFLARTRIRWGVTAASN
jgi:formyltetrahydrofolate deformylase